MGAFLLAYVIIDTSSMLYGFLHRRSVFEAARAQFHAGILLVSKGIINELTRISSNKGRRGSYARMALLDLKAKRIEVDDIADYPDSWIYNRASADGTLTVITNDTALAKRLLRLKTKVYRLTEEGSLKEAK